MLLHLKDEASFEREVLEGDVLVDFFATWCGPCKMLAPELEELAEEHEDIKVVKIDVDELPRLASKFNIRAVPTLLVYRNGELKKTVSGYMDKDALVDLVKNA